MTQSDLNNQMCTKGPEFKQYESHDLTVVTISYFRLLISLNFQSMLTNASYDYEGSSLKPLNPCCTQGYPLANLL